MDKNGKSEILTTCLREAGSAKAGEIQKCQTLNSKF
jgi:hypothetical protein